MIQFDECFKIAAILISSRMISRDVQLSAGEGVQVNTIKKRNQSGNMKLKRIIEWGKDLSQEGKEITSLIGVRGMKEEIQEGLIRMRIGKRKICSAGKREMAFRLLLNRRKI